MKARSIHVRQVANQTMVAVSTLAALMGILALALILYEVLRRGAGAINWSFFTRLPAPAGETGGGVANAIVGTLEITALATLIGVPLGLFAGVFLAEFGQRSRLAPVIRFLANVLMGTPSIIVGVFVYGVVVVPNGHFSGYAGAVALAVIMIPLVARTTEDILNLVPDTLRESALALGAPRWKVTLSVVFRAARNGLLTGGLLAVARVSGETAPLLFTALNSQFWSASMSRPTGNLTVTIFNYAMSPFADMHRIAWGASFLITVGVLVLTIVSRLILHERKQ